MAATCIEGTRFLLIFSGLNPPTVQAWFLQTFEPGLERGFFPKPVGNRRIPNTSIHPPARKHTIMLSWSLTFLILAIIAGILGFGGIAGAAAGIAKILFIVFLVLLIVSAISRALRGNSP